MGAQKYETIEESDDKSIEDLPAGWSLTSVGELFQIVGGGTPSTKIPEYWDGDIPWITSADIYGIKKIVTRRNINQNAIKNSAAHLVPKGSIIVVTRVSLGRIAICDTPISFSQDCHALIPKTDSIDPEFALFYLSQAVQTFQSKSRGTTISGVTVKVVSSLPFPLPPLAEQQRIVARVEALLMHVNAARDRLSRVPLIMKRFRQAILAAAFSGKFTQDWRPENEFINSIDQNEINFEENLPEGWKLVTIHDVCEVNPPKPSKDFLPATTPVTFVPMPAVDADLGTITNPQLKPYLVVRSGGFTFFRDGDVIMAKITPCMENGKAAIIHGMENGIAFGSTEFHVMRSRGEILPEYIYHYIRQESFRKDAENHFTGSVGQKRVPSDFIKQSVLPLPPLTEQHEIVRRVGLLFERADAIDREVAAAGRRCERLTQAVLGKAFRGELVK